MKQLIALAAMVLLAAPANAGVLADTAAKAESVTKSAVRMLVVTPVKLVMGVTKQVVNKGFSLVETLKDQSFSTVESLTGQAEKLVD